jgi:U3 small nucleolar RNA-associated protein 11
VHRAESERPKLTGDMLKVLKTQDKTYINTVKSAEDAKISKLKASLHGIGLPVGNKHVVFDEEDTGAGASGPVGAGAGAAASRKRGRSDVEEEEKEEVLERGKGAAENDDGDDDEDMWDMGDAKRKEPEVIAEIPAISQPRRAVRRAYEELAQREERSKKLGNLAAHMDLERALLQKGRRKKVKDADGDTPAVYVWKSQRRK